MKKCFLFLIIIVFILLLSINVFVKNILGDLL